MASTGFLTGLGAAVASPLKITEKVFEIRAVDRQASSLLETINQVNGQLEVARELRRQKSGLLSATEKKHMEDTFSSTDRAIGHVSDLVEKCRVALKTDNGNIAMRTRIMFVLRDSPRIQTSLQQLTIAGQSLNTVCLLLLSRDNDEQRKILRSLSGPRPGPPSYEEHNFLTERRSRNLLRRASNSMSTVGQHSHEFIQNSDGIPEIPEEDVDPFNWDTASEKARRDRNELFFEHRGSQGSEATSPTGYLPYRAGRTSPSMTSLQSTTSTASYPTRSYSYTPIQGVADGFRELSMRNRGDSWSQSSVAASETPQDEEDLPTTTSPFRRQRPMSADRDSLSSYRAFSENQYRSSCRPVPGLPLSNLPPRYETAPSTPTDTNNSPAASHPVFVLETSEEVVPRPLFHKMVKIDLTDEEPGISAQLTDDKFPIDPPAPIQSELPGVFYEAPEPVPISAETAGGMLTRARSKRYVDVESKSRREAAVAAAATKVTVPAPPVPMRGPEYAPEVVMVHSSNLAVPRPSTAHSWRDSDISSIRSLGVPATNQAVGRARSRKWQEMQYEKSERLVKAGTAGL